MSYSVEVQPGDQSFLVEPEESVLDAALRQGVSLPYGCRNGACGSCKGKLLAGEVRYPEGLPKALSRREADSGLALFCQARACGDLAIEVDSISSVKNIRVRVLPCRVAKKRQLAHDVMALYLKLPENQRMQFLAGQYIDILMRDGRRRAFSLANAPEDDEFLELHVRHVTGGEFSEYVFSKMQERALLRIRGPLGTFYLRNGSGRPVIFIAGGTGFAPIKGIIEHALVEGVSRPMYLYWGARTRADLYMGDLASRWAREHAELHYIPVLSDPVPEDRWTGRMGLVHEAILEDFADLTSYEVYASGPPVMVYAARDTFEERGLDPERFYSDAFEYAHETGHNG